MYESVINFPVRSFNYSIPYLLLCLLVILVGYRHVLSFTRKKFHLWIGYLFIGVFIFFFGFRWHILTDSIAYQGFYDTLQPIFQYDYIKANTYWWDIGFLLFAMLCKQVGLDFLTFMTLNSLIDVCMLSKCFKKYSINIPWSCLAFLAFNGILIEFNLIRNFKSILLFLISLSYIKERNIGKFMICNIIGILFHSSAILFIPLYWLLYKRYNAKILIILITGVTIVNIFYPLLLRNITIDIINDYLTSEKLKTFSETADEMHKLSIGLIERILTFILGLYVLEQEKSNDKNYIIFFNMYVVFYVMSSLFSFNEVFVERFSIPFAPSYWFLYPYIIQFFFKKGRWVAWIFLMFVFAKVYMTTHICSAYYENRLFPTTTIYERTILNEKAKGL